MTAPCMSVCPTKLKIPKYIEEIAEGMPGGLARHHPGGHLHGRDSRAASACGPASRTAGGRTSTSRSPSRYLKRFAADYEVEKEKTRRSRKDPHRAQKVAVLGAGPAGLSCAYYLAQMGLQA